MKCDRLHMKAIASPKTLNQTFIMANTSEMNLRTNFSHPIETNS